RGERHEAEREERARAVRERERVAAVHAVEEHAGGDREEEPREERGRGDAADEEGVVGEPGREQRCRDPGDAVAEARAEVRREDVAERDPEPGTRPRGRAWARAAADGRHPPRLGDGCCGQHRDSRLFRTQQKTERGGRPDGRQRESAGDGTSAPTARSTNASVASIACSRAAGSSGTSRPERHALTSWTVVSMSCAGNSPASIPEPTMRRRIASTSSACSRSRCRVDRESTVRRSGPGARWKTRLSCACWRMYVRSCSTGSSTSSSARSSVPTYCSVSWVMNPSRSASLSGKWLYTAVRPTPAAAAMSASEIASKPRSVMRVESAAKSFCRVWARCSWRDPPMILGMLTS